MYGKLSGCEFMVFDVDETELSLDEMKTAYEGPEDTKIEYPVLDLAGHVTARECLD